MAGACDRLRICFFLYLLINLIPNNTKAFANNINQYNVDSKLPYINVESIRFRAKRETTTPYQSVLETSANNNTITNAVPTQLAASVETQPQTVVLSKSGVASTQTTQLAKEEKSTNEQSINSTAGHVAVYESSDSQQAAATLLNTYASVANNKPLLGVNGTGQRKDFTSTVQSAVVSEPIAATPAKKNSTKKISQLLQQTASSPTTNFDDFFNTVDISENKTRELLNNQSLVFKEENHTYYNSTQLVNETAVKQSWELLKSINPNQMLSASHRRAITVQLKFDFPFYGNPVRNITVATGGFLYTGEYVHSWLAATQYIAPLMANFDTSLLNDSYVRYDDNGTVFNVLWENVSLQDRPDAGQFTFSASLYNTGDIVFTYFKMPIKIEAIQDDKHPVKVGLSDAYIMDKVIFFSRRKTIYEYHRVNFNEQNIQNNTIIYLKALPTCLGYNDCESCLNHETTFLCMWCPGLNKCSTGTDRKRQDWLQKGCERSVVKEVSQCAAKGVKGNDATSQIEINHSTEQEHNNQSRYDTLNHNASNEHIINGAIDGNKNMPFAAAKEESKNNIGLALGLMIPICLVMTILIWMLYAYRNPHTKSGQLLIQYRPTQWSWRRGEARYTAATIHM